MAAISNERTTARMKGTPVVAAAGETRETAYGFVTVNRASWRRGASHSGASSWALR